VREEWEWEREDKGFVGKEEGKEGQKEK